MTNYISQISDAISVSASDIVSLYKRTGKDKSKFFPLLNYAAMRILPVYEEEQEKAALEWIGENIGHFIFPVIPELTQGFGVTKIDGVDHTAGSAIFLGESSHIGVSTASQRRDLFYMLRPETSDPAKTGLIWACPLVVKSVMCSISDSLGEAIKRRRKEIESFPSTKHIMRVMKDYKRSGNGVSHRLSNIISKKASPCERYVTFPVMARDNLFAPQDKYVCSYDSQNKECMLFNGRRIVSMPDFNDVFALEPDDSMALEILHGYIDGIRRMKRAVDCAESQRNALLALL